MELETRRLLLRAVDEGDAEFLVALRTDPTVRRYLGGAMRPDAATAVVEGNTFVVTLRASLEPIGLVMLHPGHGGTEISFEFLPSSWSQGFASEAVRRVIDFAFDAGGLAELLAVTQTANVRSCRLLERLGMTACEAFEEFGEQQRLYRARRSASF